MQYFAISLIAGSFILLLLLTVFFTAGKKNKKQRAADLQLVQSCGDEGLLRLFEQSDSENERDGIVEFIKEKLARDEQELTDSSFDLAAAGDLAPAEAPIPAPTVEHAIISGNTAYGEPGQTHILALETVDWQAIEQELQQRREEEARIMAQNQQIQEVFSKIRDVEERLAAEPPAENEQ